MVTYRNIRVINNLESDRIQIMEENEGNKLKVFHVMEDLGDNRKRIFDESDKTFKIIKFVTDFGNGRFRIFEEEHNFSSQ